MPNRRYPDRRPGHLPLTRADIEAHARQDTRPARMLGGLLVVALVIVLGALLVLAGKAVAAERDDIDTYLRVARGHFGAQHCPQTEVRWTAALPDGTAAWAWLPDPDGTPHCEIDINPRWYARASWLEACVVLVHEHGHNEGHEHSAIPGDIMSALGDLPYATFAPCRQANPWRHLVALQERLLARADRLAGRCWRIDRRASMRRSQRCWRKVMVLEDRALQLSSLEPVGTVAPDEARIAKADQRRVD